jgi:hypothetical protein
MATAVFLLTLSFAYILLGTCAQFTIAMFTSHPFLNLHRQYLPFFIVAQAIFICLLFVRYLLCLINEVCPQRIVFLLFDVLSGFRRESFVFLYPFLLTLLLHLCSNLWYILNLIQLQKYQSIEVQRFFEYCSKDMLDMNIETKQCTCVRENDNDKYLVDMPCMKVKLLIELLQLMPFVRCSRTLCFSITLSTSNRLAFFWFWLIFTHSYWWHSCIFMRKDHY